MTTKYNTIKQQQAELASELSAEYGIDPSEVIFFGDDPRPLFSYEAGCILVNALVNPREIDIEPVESVLGDAVSYRCMLTLANGNVRSVVGTANVGETDCDGQPLSPAQIEALAQSRALRGVLRAAGIDLVKLHRNRSGVVEFTGPERSDIYRATLIAQAHMWAKKAGLISGDNDSLYRGTLRSRYDKNSSTQLTDEELADFVAFLSVLSPPQRKAA